MYAPEDLRLQTDIAARLASIPFFADLAITQESEGFTPADVQKALGPMYAGGVAGAQKGTLIIVRMTEEGPDEKTPNVPGPRDVFYLTVRVLQVRKVVLAQRPVGKHYSEIAWWIKRAGHQCNIGTTPVLYRGSEPYNDENGTVGKDIYFEWSPSPVKLPACVQPTASIGQGGAVAWTCNTPGATVYVTTDEGYPAPINDNLPLGGFVPPAGTILRAVAYADGLLPSGITEHRA